MREIYLKSYGALLFGGGVYYGLLFAFQYSGLYESWQAWAAPEQGGVWHPMLFMFLLIAAGTPLVMLLSGLMIYKNYKLKLYLAIPLAVLLLLSGLVGKLILAVGTGIYIYYKWLGLKRT